MTGIPEQLMWESLKKRRKDSSLIMLYEGTKGVASLSTDDFVPSNRHTRAQGYKTFSMLNSIEHEILNARKYKNIK